MTNNLDDEEKYEVYGVFGGNDEEHIKFLQRQLEICLQANKNNDNNILISNFNKGIIIFFCALTTFAYIVPFVFLLIYNTPSEEQKSFVVFCQQSAPIILSILSGILIGKAS